MTRDQARALFEAKGLDYSILSVPNLRRLIEHLDAAIKESGAMGRDLRMKPKFKVYTFGSGAAELRCRADYFKDREAVTFNEGGFIGFAGWAGDREIMPFLTGFERWCEEMAAKRAGGVPS